jgi:integrase
MGPMKNYYTTQKYIKKFLKENYGTNDKYLSELNYKFIMDFDFFLCRLKNKQGNIALQNNGVMKHLERFFKMINLSLKHEWIEKDPFHAYKLEFEKTEREFLTKQELKRLEEYSFTRSSLQTVRDLFVFSCYTGLAYIDVFNLLPSNVINIEDGELWIKTSRQKTSTPVTVPLLPKAIDIIEKYKEHPKALSEGKLLPTYSNQNLTATSKKLLLFVKLTNRLHFILPVILLLLLLH